jgi:hypothetical protein
MHTPETPRYRRRSELDTPGAAWEHLDTGAIRFTLPDYDLNSAEARADDDFMALPLEARSEQLRAHHEALLSAAGVAGLDMLRLVITRRALGGDLEVSTARYFAREEAAGPLVDLGEVEIYRLSGGVEIEMELDRTPSITYRRAHLSWRDGTVDSSNTPEQLLELATLLGRPEVVSALARWAAEDAAVAALKGGVR